jgi:hypothetical protein
MRKDNIDVQLSSRELLAAIAMIVIGLAVLPVAWRFGMTASEAEIRMAFWVGVAIVGALLVGLLIVGAQYVNTSALLAMLRLDDVGDARRDRIALTKELRMATQDNRRRFKELQQDRDRGGGPAQLAYTEEEDVIEGEAWAPQWEDVTALEIE